MKKIAIAFSLLTSLTFWATAAELINVSIDGALKKTKNETILTIIGYREGDEIDSSAEDNIHQKLLKSGLFINEDIVVDLTIIGDQAELELYLEEKVTTVPIPLVSVSDDSFQAGLFLINSNLFGRGDQMFLGFIAGRDSQYATISFTDKNFLLSSWNLGGRTSFSNRETKISDSKNRKITDYTSLMANGGVFTEWNQSIWSLSGGIDAGAMAVDGYNGIKKTTLFIATPRVSAGLNTFRYGEYFPEGFTAETKIETGLYGDIFENSASASLEAGWKKNLLPRLQISVDSQGAAYFGDEILSPIVFSPILPNTVHADRTIQGSLSLTAAVLDFSWGYLALPLNYSIGMFDGISGDNELFQGPSTGLSLNLKKIALPALSFIYGWNLETSEGQFQFNIGFH